MGTLFSHGDRQVVINRAIADFHTSTCSELLKLTEKLSAGPARALSALPTIFQLVENVVDKVLDHDADEGEYQRAEAMAQPGSHIFNPFSETNAEMLVATVKAQLNGLVTTCQSPQWPKVVELLRRVPQHLDQLRIAQEKDCEVRIRREYKKRRSYLELWKKKYSDESLRRQHKGAGPAINTKDATSSSEALAGIIARQKAKTETDRQELTEEKRVHERRLRLRRARSAFENFKDGDREAGEDHIAGLVRTLAGYGEELKTQKLEGTLNRLRADTQPRAAAIEMLRLAVENDVASIDTNIRQMETLRRRKEGSPGGFEPWSFPFAVSSVLAEIFDEIESEAYTKASAATQMPITGNPSPTKDDSQPRPNARADEQNATEPAAAPQLAASSPTTTTDEEHASELAADSTPGVTIEPASLATKDCPFDSWSGPKARPVLQFLWDNGSLNPKKKSEVKKKWGGDDDASFLTFISRQNAKMAETDLKLEIKIAGETIQLSRVGRQK